MKYDTIIVGAGTMGMAAGYYLSKKGKRVLLLDAFDPPHDRGSHHGDTRIIRYSYGEGDHYVPLLLRAQELWKELEEQSQAHVFTETGVLNAGKEESSFMQNVRSSSANYRLPLDVLTAKEVNGKWTGFSLPQHYIGCFEPMGGILHTTEIVKAYRTLAEESGALLRSNSKVTEIRPYTDKVVVSTVDQLFEAESLIISAGAWSAPILSMIELELPLKPLRKTFAWYDAGANYELPNFPCFTFQDETGTYYGFPSIGGMGLKVGKHDGGEFVDPNNELRRFDKGDDAEIQHATQRFLAGKKALVRGKTCLYTMTPDEAFVIDRHSQYANIAIAAGFSGHGFKFGSVVGEVLSDLVTGEKMSFDLSPFSYRRFLDC